MPNRSLLIASLLLPAVALGGFSVSSFKKETRLGSNTWNAASAIDGNLETAWMTDPEQENAGQYFEVDVPKSEIDKVALVIGWDKSEDDFKDYARVKTLKVEVFDQAGGDDTGKLVSEYTARFEDQRGWQVIDIPNAKVGDEVFGGRVRMTITSTYPGVDFPNLAVSEVLVHLAEIDAPASISEAPTSVAAGHAPEAMTDGKSTTFYASESPEGVRFELGSAGFGLSKIGFTQGPKSHARPKTVKVTYSEQERTFTLEDKTGMQWFELPAIVGYTGSGYGDVTVEVVDTYAGAAGGVGIGEVALKATTFEG